MGHGTIKTDLVRERPPAPRPTKSAFDTQIDGDHYSKMKIQPFQYSMENGLDPMQHTIIKYVTRFRDKNGLADLQKARHVIDLLLEYEQSRIE